MTTIAAHPPTTLAQAFERAIHGASDRAAQRAAGIVMRTDHMPPIEHSPAHVVFRADEHPATVPPEHALKGWLGSRGSTVLTPHLTLDDYPDETFATGTATINAEQDVADAIRHLQDYAAQLQQRVWDLEDARDA